MPIDYESIWETMIAHTSRGDWSPHGPNHWKNVERNGLQLARLNGADETIIRLFAVFHDVERQSEGTDPGHGARAAELVEQLYGHNLLAAGVDLETLLDACRGHNDGLTSSDLTIGTCWDADRMDLPRVGITPKPEKMSTPHGKAYAIDGPSALDPKRQG